MLSRLASDLSAEQAKLQAERKEKENIKEQREGMFII